MPKLVVMLALLWLVPVKATAKADYLGAIACINVATAKVVLEQMVQNYAEADNLWLKAEDLGWCRRVLYVKSTEKNFRKLISDKQYGPWIYSFYLTHTGEVLLVSRKVLIIINGPVRVV